MARSLRLLAANRSFVLFLKLFNPLVLRIERFIFCVDHFIFCVERLVLCIDYFILRIELLTKLLNFLSIFDDRRIINDFIGNAGGEITACY